MAKKNRKPSSNSHPTPEQFVIMAIEDRKKKTGRNGMHTVWSGFNSSFRAFFPDVDPVETTKAMAQKGYVIEIAGFTDSTGSVQKNRSRLGVTPSSYQRSLPFPVG